MNLLLDTCVLLWWLNDDPTISGKAASAVRDGRNLVFISAATIWEIRIKQNLGKLEIPADFLDVLHDGNFEMLDITAAHAYAAGSLPDHHNDPFDRMLVAQAGEEKLTLITRDVQLKKYRIPIIKA